ncbi:MAG: GntR family transcriptional regulator [Candidatus Caldatribacteriota bacterium]
MINYFSSPKKKLSLKDKAFQVIKLEIILGNLKPGSFLVEEKISKSMKISRGPIREAFNKLEKEGFVNIIPYKGTMVSNITQQEVKDISRIREVLEPLAAIESLPKISMSNLERLKKNFIELSFVLENKTSKSYFFVLDRDFHKLLYSECGNRKLVEILDNFSDHTNWFMNLFIKKYPYEESIKEHLLIIEAIRKKEVELVKLNIKKHLERVKNMILSEISS